ncbi:MAG: hypothetical protein L0K12_15280 [Brevibacterium aurantiacum]|nr:hypothetical protein [Brevibacterium aurantiacum]
MAADYRTENCPNSTVIPPAVVNDDGFCTEHGWDCDDFAAYLDENDPIEDDNESDSPITYTTSSADEEDTEDGVR